MSGIGIAVSDGVGVKENLGGKGPPVSFNAVGLLFVNERTGEVEVVKWYYLEATKSVRTVRRGDVVEAKMEVK